MSDTSDTVTTVLTDAKALAPVLETVLTVAGQPAAAAAVGAVLALAAQGPELYALIKSDIDMFSNGQMTIKQLQARFATTQATFEALSARWLPPAS